MAVQPGLCQTLSETPKTGFLASWFHYSLVTATDIDRGAKPLLSNHNAVGHVSCCSTKHLLETSPYNPHGNSLTLPHYKSRSVCRHNVLAGSGYIHVHDCRNLSDTKPLFSRQQFPMPKRLYTRLPCIKYKSVIYTAAVFHTKGFIYTAAVHKV